MDSAWLDAYLGLAECAATGRLALFFGILGLCTVEHLEELGDTVAHAAVHVRLGALDWVSVVDVLW